MGPAGGHPLTGPFSVSAGRDRPASPDYTKSNGSVGGPGGLVGGTFVSIVRVGLSENKGFGDGYDAIFGKKKEAAGKEETAKARAGRSATKKKKKPGKKK